MTELAATIRRAKARLADMTINEVSVVDKAANLRNFVLTKKDDAMPKTEKMTLKLPAAAQQALMDGLGQVIDKVTALASVVGDAEKDDTAAVPEELNTSLTQIAQMLTGMASQYGGAGSAAAGAGSAAAGADTAPGGTNGPSEQQPPGNPNGGADQGKSLDGTQKALPPEHKDPGMKTELHDGDSLKTILRKAIAVAAAEVVAFEALEKAGRKMAGARYKKLAELHDNLGKLLNELAYDESAEAKGAAEAEAEKAKKPPVPPAKEDAPAAKSEPSPEVAALTKQVAELTEKLGAALAKSGEQETKIAKLGTELSAVSKVQGVSNAGPVDGPPTSTDGSKPAVVWPVDMSAHVAKKREAASKTNGAR